MEEPEILIVDDNPEIREVAMVLLQGEGFTVGEAGDGKEALDKIEHGAYDLILLDVMMPGLNGYQTCMEIRKKSNVPILFLSARTQVEDKIMGFSSGGDDYLPKPFSYQELISRVKALVRRYHVYHISGQRPEDTGRKNVQRSFGSVSGSRNCMEKRKRDFSDRYGVFYSLYPYEAQKADFFCGTPV